MRENQDARKQPPASVGNSATGSNAGPDRAGMPDADTDAMMGTTSAGGAQHHKGHPQRKPGRGSFEETDS